MKGVDNVANKIKLPVRHLKLGKLYYFPTTSCPSHLRDFFIYTHQAPSEDLMNPIDTSMLPSIMLPSKDS